MLFIGGGLYRENKGHVSFKFLSDVEQNVALSILIPFSSKSVKNEQALPETLNWMRKVEVRVVGILLLLLLAFVPLYQR